MTTLVYALACLALCASAAWLRLISRARTEMGGLWTAVAELGQPGLSDEAREQRARQAAVAALAGTAGLFARIGAVCVITLAPVLLADAVRLASAPAVAAFALRPDVLVATSVVAVMLLVFVRRVRGAGV